MVQYSLVFLVHLSPCTGENDPMGSSLKKNNKMDSKTVPNKMGSQVRSGVENPFCHFFHG